jgi:hypothetical protein
MAKLITITYEALFLWLNRQMSLSSDFRLFLLLFFVFCLLLTVQIKLIRGALLPNQIHYNVKNTFLNLEIGTGMAAKLNGNTASSAFNAYFMQQQAHGPGQQQHGHNSEPAVADLHLKMSKKIAQLTKVIITMGGVF